jgi:hypothetical protein
MLVYVGRIKGKKGKFIMTKAIGAEGPKSVTQQAQENNNRTVDLGKNRGTGQEYVMDLRGKGDFNITLPEGAEYIEKAPVFSRGEGSTDINSKFDPSGKETDRPGKFEKDADHRDATSKFIPDRKDGTNHIFKFTDSDGTIQRRHVFTDNGQKLSVNGKELGEPKFTHNYSKDTHNDSKDTHPDSREKGLPDHLETMRFGAVIDTLSGGEVPFVQGEREITQANMDALSKYKVAEYGITRASSSDPVRDAWIKSSSAISNLA